MVAKLLGLATGALAASALVIGFNAWRHVSDDDLLSSYLADHCLPYVTAGAQPFVDMGRTPGVYDDVDLRDELADGRAKLLLDGRFIAQWGTAQTTDPARYPAIRLCDVAPTYNGGTTAAFEVDADGFLPRYTGIITQYAPLRADIETLADNPQTVGWFTEGSATSATVRGLRVVMVASPGLVSSVLVADDLAD